MTESFTVSGKITINEAPTADSVKTFYSSAVGVIGQGKLAGSNATTILPPHKKYFNEAKTASADLKKAEPLLHTLTVLYPTVVIEENTEEFTTIDAI